VAVYTKGSPWEGQNAATLEGRYARWKLTEKARQARMQVEDKTGLKHSAIYAGIALGTSPSQFHSALKLAAGSKRKLMRGSKRASPSAIIAPRRHER
jgi:hypothetical protein